MGTHLTCCICLALATGQSHGARPHRIVIELNVSGDMAYHTVLGNAEHLLKAFAPDPVEVEIVCEGRGLRMLLEKSGRVAARIQCDSKLGVQFRACGNTVKAMKLNPKELPAFVRVVDSGVAEVVRRQEAGWAYLKGA